MALGAQRSNVQWLIVREGLFLVLLGLAAGLPLVLVATRLISTLLYGLTSADPAALGAGCDDDRRRGWRGLSPRAPRDQSRSADSTEIRVSGIEKDEWGLIGRWD